MKIAVCSKENSRISQVDDRFGRCNYFLIFNSGKKGYGSKEYIRGYELIESIENNAKDASGGAGLKAVEEVVSKEANIVIAGKFGPKAKRALEDSGIKYYAKQGMVEDALNEIMEKSGDESDKSVDKSGSDSKNKRIFVPLLENNGVESKISTHFGHAPYFAIVTIGKEPKILENNLDHHDENKSPVRQIIDIANPDCVVAKGMGKRAIQLFEDNGIELKRAQKDTLQSVMDGFENLPKLTQSCGH
ncbi:MAG: NifB/NifX family molybdenum-iron cluster-binding protein [Candidatus Nanoarchaeia archaeon]